MPSIALVNELTEFAARAAEAAATRNSHLKDRWVRCVLGDNDVVSVKLSQPVILRDQDCEQPHIRDIACTLEAEDAQVVMAMREPATLMSILMASNVSIQHPLALAQVYDLARPGAIEGQLKSLAAAHGFEAAAMAVETGDQIRQILSKAAAHLSEQHPTTHLAYNLVTAEGQTWSMSRNGGEVVVTDSPIDAPKCEIRFGAECDLSAFSDPVHGICALIREDIRTTNPCRARQLGMAMWHDALETVLPEAIYVAFYDPGASEYAADGPTYQSYIMVNGALVPITFVDDEGDAIIEGDIIIGRTQEMLDLAERVDGEAGGAHVEGVIIRDYGDPSKYLWTGNTVPYVIDSGLKKTDRVDDAIKLFSGTNLRFVVRTTEKDYIRIVRSTTASGSPVGKQGDEQKLKLTDGASAGTLAHEFCHALGIGHEQSRIDRDDWVKILTDNIVKGKEHNFRKSLPALNAFNKLGDVRARLATPAVDPSNGARWLIKEGATGAWNGHDNEIATWSSGAWAYTAPATKDLVRVAAEDKAYEWDGTKWSASAAQYEDIGTYDYGSIMQYSERTFGKKKNSYKKKITIEPLKSLDGKVMGQRKKLSDSDVDTLNTIYP